MSAKLIAAVALVIAHAIQEVAPAGAYMVIGSKVANEAAGFLNDTFRHGQEISDHDARNNGLAKVFE